MTKREKYAVEQHDLICEMLGVGKSPDDPGDTAYEAVAALIAVAHSVQSAQATHGTAIEEQFCQ